MPNQTTRFSIVIPTLNEEEYLPRLLADLSQQTYTDFEVIVVDAKSEDQTLSKANRFSSKIPQFKIITSDKRNVAYQRNLGAQKAQGDYLLFIDADTRLPPHFLQGVDYRLTVSGAKLFTTHLKTDAVSETKDKVIANLFNTSLETGKAINYPWSFGAMTGCHRQTFLDNDGFNEAMEFAEDREIVQRFIQKGVNFHIFKDPCYIFSLRRFQKAGTLTALNKYAKVYTKMLLNRPISQAKDYPMGGDVTWKDQNTQQLITRIQTSYSKGLKNPRIINKIKSWLTNYT